MKSYSISRLARACGLSRSTLLYYDRLGLLRPSGRTGADYRVYTDRDLARLMRIKRFRAAGLSLKEIISVLAKGGSPDTKLLEQRLSSTSEEIVSLKHRQRTLAGMLRKVASGKRPHCVDKPMWIAMLKAAGMDQDAMHRWHVEFERRSPEGHHEFLLSLGIPPSEAAHIRSLSSRGAGD